MHATSTPQMHATSTPQEHATSTPQEHATRRVDQPGPMCHPSMGALTRASPPWERSHAPPLRGSAHTPAARALCAPSHYVCDCVATLCTLTRTLTRTLACTVACTVCVNVAWRTAVVAEREHAYELLEVQVEDAKRAQADAVAAQDRAEASTSAAHAKSLELVEEMRVCRLETDAVRGDRDGLKKQAHRDTEALRAELEGVRAERDTALSQAKTSSEQAEAMHGRVAEVEVEMERLRAAAMASEARHQEQRISLNEKEEFSRISDQNALDAVKRQRHEDARVVVAALRETDELLGAMRTMQDHVSHLTADNARYVMSHGRVCGSRM